LKTDEKAWAAILAIAIVAGAAALMGARAADDCQGALAIERPEAAGVHVAWHRLSLV
jgi:hypothetical protein